MWDTHPFTYWWVYMELKDFSDPQRRLQYLEDRTLFSILLYYSTSNVWVLQISKSHMLTAENM